MLGVVTMSMVALPDGIRQVDLRMYQDATRLPFADVVTRLRDLLGAKLVAYLGSVQETRAVRQWADGTGRAPAEPVQARLRLAYRVAGLISDQETPVVAATWLQGMCPQLGDQIPARLLREGALEDVQKPLLDAARAFVSA